MPLVSILIRRHIVVMSAEIHSEIIERNRKSADVSVQTCDWPGCNDKGLCRAPKSRLELGTFLWFCKTHVREYNLSWNYYAGMTDAEIEDDVRRDTIWHRPSWTFGSFFFGSGELDPEKIVDHFGVLGNQSSSKSNHSPNEISQTLNNSQQRALKVFQLSEPISTKVVKAQYKKLAKLHHPDANGANTTYSEKLSEKKIREINQAYKILLDLLA